MACYILSNRGHSSFSESTSAKDGFWYHSLKSEPPPNYTPGLIPLLRNVLLNAVEKGATCRAVLCYERAVHIYHEIWDVGWGCGYRNFMMLCAVLMDQRIQPAYSSLLCTPAPPSVNNLKRLIEEAWSQGFDPEGAQGLRGKLVGHRKWIGTAELYVAFTYRGIPSLLVDFETPNGNVTPLLDWIRRYFDGQLPSHHTSVQERWQGPPL
ncbi:peptidase family C78-domain-containing protein [Multifurca ochricompacta]|uniref:Peptidase family C78-domain-containing protein n=1 Tax=Multifurca ochricompacta TaxID=376703 RepID=A0AAD4QPD4_9AGAM|nr:peptidase family C78-domain-containing protein [Multifurca ochricompacta]